MAGPQLEYFGDDGQFPNSRLPLLIYKAAVADPSPEAMEELFRRNGWPPGWRATVFTYHHYHSTAHEVLGIAQGHGTLMLGGYPPGQHWDLLRGDPADRVFALRAIAKVPLPETDPVQGAGGALLQHWT